MIRLEVEQEHGPLIDLLNAILQAQEDLRKGSDIVEIRVLVARLSDTKHHPVEGREISTYLSRELRRSIAANGTRKGHLSSTLPGGKNVSGWLRNDLFGTPVARAFRASSIPKECDLVIERSVAALVRPRLSDAEVTVGNIRFGPSIAFSPINGMSDLYDIGRPTLQADGKLGADTNKEHVWLRTVSRADTRPKVGRPHTQSTSQAVASDDALSRRQQKQRVLTEFVMLPDKLHAKQSTTFWINALAKIENKADYFRFIGKPIKKHTWRIDKAGTIIEEESPAADLVVLGAYPEFDTYFNIRDAIRELSEQCADANVPSMVLRFAQTTLLWSPPAPGHKARKCWRRAKSGEIFILLMGRAKDDDRSDDPLLSGTQWHKELSKTRFYDGVHPDMGAVMGEWDYYAIYDLKGTRIPNSLKVNSIVSICKNNILPKMERLRFYLCQVPEIQ